MDRERLFELLNASLDGETPPADLADLEAHLAESAEDRALADGLRQQDAELQRAFAPRRAAAEAVAAEVIARLPGVSVTPGERGSQVEGGRQEPERWQMFLAAAAGFLLAVLIFRPWKPGVPPQVAGPQQGTVSGKALAAGDSVRQPGTGTIETTRMPIAQLAMATGEVEVLPQNRNAWANCPTSFAIDPGTIVRTGPESRCEFTVAQGCEVRLNTDTEMCFREPRLVELTHGQLWSNVAAADKAFSFKCSGATVVTDRGRFDLRCASGETTLTVVEGTAAIHGAKAVRNIPAGERVKIVAGEAGESSRAWDEVLATRWVNELLVLKGPENPEMTARIDHMLALLGRTKISYMYEEEIRALGESCVLPLTRFMQASADEEPAAPRRVAAAKILADLAPARSIPDLIGLLADKDPLVRFHISHALTRLTGRDQGRTPEQWRNDTLTVCLPAQQTWEAWWSENQHRYPGLGRPSAGGKKG